MQLGTRIVHVVGACLAPSRYLTDLSLVVSLVVQNFSRNTGVCQISNCELSAKSLVSLGFDAWDGIMAGFSLADVSFGLFHTSIGWN